MLLESHDFAHETRSYSKQHISQKVQIERGRAGRNIAGGNFLEIVCPGTSCQQPSGAAAQQFKQGEPDL